MVNGGHVMVTAVIVEQGVNEELKMNDFLELLISSYVCLRIT